MDETQTTSAPAEKPLANIVRGTLPKALVYLIRFGETGNKEADIAKKYGTTTGKVADILKNRNFAYIDQDFRPTAEDKAAAIAWLRQVPNYDEVGTDGVVIAVDEMSEADEASLKALQEKRAAVRAKNAASSGETAPKSNGGGKRGKKTKASSEVSTEDADSLMS